MYFSYYCNGAARSAKDTLINYGRHITYATKHGAGRVFFSNAFILNGS
jgi:hypothetical protein